MKFILTLLVLSTLGSILVPVITIAVECPPGSGEDNGLNLCYPSFLGAPSLTSETKVEQMVAWFYVFFVGISGLAAFVMITWGGVQWMASQGNPTAIGDARDKIKMALLGLLLVLASFLILQIINPELTLLKNPL